MARAPPTLPEEPILADRIALEAGDGHTLEAWRAAPARPSGGIVVLHAIYGMTSHMADVCDLYAEAGIAAIAPALYDRSGRGIVFGYDDAGRAGGMAQREGLGETTVLMDVEAALDALRPAGPVAVQGFCTGGTWAWIAAARLAFDAAVIYYGSDVYQASRAHPLMPGDPALRRPRRGGPVRRSRGRSATRTRGSSSTSIPAPTTRSSTRSRKATTRKRRHRAPSHPRLPQGPFRRCRTMTGAALP